jgi:glucose-6-phosphate isomerase
MNKGLDLSALGVNQTILKQQGGIKPDLKPPIHLDLSYLFSATDDPNPISKEDFELLIPEVVKHHQRLKQGEGDCLDRGIPMLGWMTLPETIADRHLQELKNTAEELSREIDAFVSLGIGGSYLGIEATWKALTHTYWNQLSREQRGDRPEIYFLGQNTDPDFFRDTMDMLQGKRVGINVISKSGTTSETAIAFRILRKLLEASFGAKAKELIIATTDKQRGALRSLSDKKGYRSFIIPDNVGGRFSIITDVGLFGLAVAGIDIDEFVQGFRDMKRRTDSNDFWHNPSMLHAAARYVAHQKGKKIEVVATNSSALYHIGRWMEQLFPESEGHQGKGMWVSPSLYSEKLHANGQMVQEGERNILETFLYLKEHDNIIPIPFEDDDADGLNYLTEQNLDLNDLNKLVIHGPACAHFRGGVPNMTIEIPVRSAYYIGGLYFMLERSVALSGYLLGHNPFVQPGVEAYKKAIFALAGKPGYQEESEKIKKEIEHVVDFP